MLTATVRMSIRSNALYDGSSRDEFVELIEEFFTSDDPDASGGWLFGKAVAAVG